jgi:hypothetical protein
MKGLRLERAGILSAEPVSLKRKVITNMGNPDFDLILPKHNQDNPSRCLSFKKDLGNERFELPTLSV